MLAVVAGLGWAAFRAYDALRENSLAPVSAIAEPWRPNLPRVGELLKVQDLADLGNKLMALSEELQTGCAGIRSALESYIQTLVDAGRYGSKSEVLREGVRLIQDRETKLAALDASIMRGIADADAGRTTPASEVFARLEDKYRAMAEQAEKSA